MELSEHSQLPIESPVLPSFHGSPILTFHIPLSIVFTLDSFTFARLLIHSFSCSIARIVCRLEHFRPHITNTLAVGV